MYLPLEGVESYVVIVNKNCSPAKDRERTLVFALFFCLFVCLFLIVGVHLVEIFSHLLVDMQLTVWTCRANAYNSSRRN